jgi:hypothetical protein
MFKIFLLRTMVAAPCHTCPPLVTIISMGEMKIFYILPHKWATLRHSQSTMQSNPMPQCTTVCIHILLPPPPGPYYKIKITQ